MLWHAVLLGRMSGVHCHGGGHGGEKKHDGIAASP